MVWDLTPPPDGIQGGKSRPNQISPTTRVAGKKHTRHTSRTDLCARGEKHAAYITHGAVCTWGKTRGIHQARSCVHVGKNVPHTVQTGWLCPHCKHVQENAVLGTFLVKSLKRLRSKYFLKELPLTTLIFEHYNL